jgi:hypothetical protein
MVLLNLNLLLPVSHLPYFFFTLSSQGLDFIKAFDVIPDPLNFHEPHIAMDYPLVTIRTTSFTPPSVIKFYLLFVYAFTCFGFLVNHLQKAHQLCID